MDPQEFDKVCAQVEELLDYNVLDNALDVLKGVRGELPDDISRTIGGFLARAARHDKDVVEKTMTREEASVQRNIIIIDVRAFCGLASKKLDLLARTGLLKPPRRPAGQESSGVDQALMRPGGIKGSDWYARGASATRAVGRIIVDGGFGTGFLVAPGLLMTNRHVIGSEAQAARAEVEFGYSRDALGKVNTPVRYPLDPQRTFRTGIPDALDYTLVAVGPAKTPGAPLIESWGKETLNPFAIPQPKESVQIIHHSDGALLSVSPGGSMVLERTNDFLRYSLSTLPGASGSPVFNDEWQVVAVHHRGDVPLDHPTMAFDKANQGVLLARIREDLGDDCRGMIETCAIPSMRSARPGEDRHDRE